MDANAETDVYRCGGSRYVRAGTNQVVCRVAISPPQLKKLGEKNPVQALQLRLTYGC